jgi:hypothetical protein
MMGAEGLVQREGWKKPFGGFSRKRVNGFIVNNWRKFFKWAIGGLR